MSVKLINSMELSSFETMKKNVSDAACSLLNHQIKATNELAEKAAVLSQVSDVAQSCILISGVNGLKTVNAGLGKATAGTAAFLGFHQIVHSVETFQLAKKVDHKYGQIRSVVYGTSGVLTALGGVSEFSKLVGSPIVVVNSALQLLGIGYLLNIIMAGWGIYRSHGLTREMDRCLKDPNLSKAEQLSAALNILKLSTEKEVVQLRFRTSAKAVKEIEDKLEPALEKLRNGDFSEAEALLQFVRLQTGKKIKLYAFSILSAVLGYISIVLTHIGTGGLSVLIFTTLSSAISLAITLWNLIHPWLSKTSQPIIPRYSDPITLHNIEVAKVFINDYNRSHFNEKTGRGQYFIIDEQRFDPKITNAQTMLDLLNNYLGKDPKRIRAVSEIACQNGMLDLNHQMVKDYKKKTGNLPLFDLDVKGVKIKKSKVFIEMKGTLTGYVSEQGNAIHIESGPRLKAKAVFDLSTNTVEYKFNLK